MRSCRQYGSYPVSGRCTGPPSISEYNRNYGSPYYGECNQPRYCDRPDNMFSQRRFSSTFNRLGQNQFRQRGGCDQDYTPYPNIPRYNTIGSTPSPYSMRRQYFSRDHSETDLLPSRYNSPYMNRERRPIRDPDFRDYRNNRFLPRFCSSWSNMMPNCYHPPRFAPMRRLRRMRSGRDGDCCGDCFPVDHSRGPYCPSYDNNCRGYPKLGNGDGTNMMPNYYNPPRLNHMRRFRRMRGGCDGHCHGDIALIDRSRPSYCQGYDNFQDDADIEDEEDEDCDLQCYDDDEFDFYNMRNNFFDPMDYPHPNFGMQDSYCNIMRMRQAEDFVQDLTREITELAELTDAVREKIRMRNGYGNTPYEPFHSDGQHYPSLSIAFNARNNQPTPFSSVVMAVLFLPCKKCLLNDCKSCTHDSIILPRFQQRCTCEAAPFQTEQPPKSDSFKNKLEPNLLPSNGPFLGDTSYNSSYQNHPTNDEACSKSTSTSVLEPSALAKFESDTTNSTTYKDWKIIKPTKSTPVQQKRLWDTGPLANETTSRHDYNLKTIERVTVGKNNSISRPLSNQPFEKSSTYRRDFRKKKIVPPTRSQCCGIDSPGIGKLPVQPRSLYASSYERKQIGPREKKRNVKQKPAPLATPQMASITEYGTNFSTA